MRRRFRGRIGAGIPAALALCAALPFGDMLGWLTPERAPLTIEVIGQTQENAPASQEGAASVLLYHTHTWEAYEMTENTRYTPTETWRTKDDRYNMVRIGEELAKELTALGFHVVHDTTDFEPPNLSGAYSRSLDMLEKRLEAGEHYDYILDIHRDAYSGPYNGANSVELDGRRAAYIMLLVGKGTGATGSGFDERPDWPQNLELAQQITEEIATLAPGMTRDVKVKTGRFNQHVSVNALLIEVGNNKNTLEEALAACPVIARALAGVHAQRRR